MSRKHDRRTVRVRIEGARAGRRLPLLDRARRRASSASTGWVRNRRDGSVEALFSGPADDVAQMLERCKDGPPSARVTAVKIVEEGGAAPAGFEVLPTE